MNPADIEIKVRPRYVPEQSSPAQKKFFFSYTISITNRGQQPCQLKSRYWLIIDSNDQQQEVRGEGVVGKQPVLHPGTAFTYTSGVTLKTAVGTMQGTYYLVDETGNPFEAPIPAFLLAQPGKIN